MSLIALDHLIPTSEPVAAGTIILELYESSIDRAQILFAAITGLELERLVEPVSNLFSTVDLGEAKDFKLETMIELLRANAGPLLVALRPILGKQLGPALSAVTIALLDTRTTRTALTTAPPKAPPALTLADDSDVETDADGVYLGSKAVRAYLRENVTLKQSIHILISGVKVNDVKGALGNLWAGLMPEDEAAEEAAPTTPKLVKPTTKKQRRERRT